MIDIVRQLEAVQREVASGRIPAGDGRLLRLRRTYDAPVEDVWEAITSPERVRRWFLPLTVDPRVGGRYQLEGNAGGTVLACERPNRLRVSWALMDTGSPTDITELEVRLSAAGGDATLLELEHTAVVPDELWEQFGPGAVGIGWDQAFVLLAHHLAGDPVGDPAGWPMTPEGQDVATRASAAWGEANVAAGADPAAAAQAAAMSTTFYVPPATD